MAAQSFYIEPRGSKTMKKYLVIAGVAIVAVIVAKRIPVIQGYL